MSTDYTSQFKTELCKRIAATQGFSEDRNSEWLGPMVHSVDAELAHLHTINAELLDLAYAFKAYLEDDSRSMRRRAECLSACAATIAKGKP